MMYKISEFSRITNLTVKALRYYDEEGILIPAHRNEDNAYRYYDGKNYREAQLIVLLRDLEFSIAEIKDVLSHCENEEDISFYLDEKKSQIFDNIKKERSLIEKITPHINQKKTEVSIMNYQVERKEFMEITVASIRFKGKYSDVGKHIGVIYRTIKNNGNGAPICILYDNEYKDDADIEICIPTKK